MYGIRFSIYYWDSMIRFFMCHCTGMQYFNVFKYSFCVKYVTFTEKKIYPTKLFLLS